MVTFLGLTGWELFFFFIIIGMFLIGSMITVFVILSRMRWPFKYEVLENIAGQGFVRTRKGRCRLIAFGDAGEEVFLLKRTKKIKIGYGKRIGKNQIGWFVSENGYWFNFNYGDGDKKLLELGVIPVDRDMRFSNSSLRKGIENRYNVKDFFQKWGVPITIGLLIFAMVVQIGGQWFLYEKQQEANSVDIETARLNKEVVELIRQTLASIDNIRSGSGIVPTNSSG